MKRTPNPSKLHPAYHGRCTRYPAFQALYVEHISPTEYEVGITSSVSLRVQGNLFYAIAFAARFWSLYIARPAKRAIRAAA